MFYAHVATPPPLAVAHVTEQTRRSGCLPRPPSGKSPPSSGVLEDNHTWTQAFHYCGGEVTVVRLLCEWQLVAGDRTSRGVTLVDAFERLLGRPVKDEEMRVVVDALERDGRLARRGAVTSRRP